jgi:hypothetical protein
MTTSCSVLRYLLVGPRTKGRRSLAIIHHPLIIIDTWPGARKHLSHTTKTTNVNTIIIIIIIIIIKINTIKIITILIVIIIIIVLTMIIQ